MNEVLQWICIAILSTFTIPTIRRFIRDFMEAEED